MNLKYFELLSPDPIYIPKTGGIISPKLRDISSVGYEIYQHYLSILSMDLKTYFTIIGQSEQFDLFSNEEKKKLNMFDLFTINNQSTNMLQNALNFFIKEDVIYSLETKSFLVKKDNDVIGMVTKENYPNVCDIICQRNCIIDIPIKYCQKYKCML